MRFHPIVQQWFTSTLGQPTAAQRDGWNSIHDRRHTLIAAPTGSGKTLAAFLAALDELTRESLDSGLPDEVRVLYISPLKALSTDIHKNLAEPRAGIAQLCAAATPPIDPSAEARALIAIMALNAPGNKRKQAQNAVEAYLVHRGR